MTDKKDVDCGCGGCGCGRSKSSGEDVENASGGDAGSLAGSLGEAIAAGAIINMENVETEENKDFDIKITEADIDGFIEKCDKEGKNPLDVVKFIAENNGMNVMSELGPDDVSKRRVFRLLKGVVKKVIMGFLSYCVDNYGHMFVQSLIDSYVSCRDSEESFRASGSDSEASVEVRPVSIRLIPVRVFKW